MRNHYTPYVLDVKHRTTKAKIDLADMRRTALRFKGTPQADLMEKLAFDFATNEMTSQFGSTKTLVGVNKTTNRQKYKQADLPILALSWFRPNGYINIETIPYNQ